jgi:hypothetical protein
MSAYANKIDQFILFIRKKDEKIAILSYDIKACEEKYKELSLKLSKSEAEL